MASAGAGPRAWPPEWSREPCSSAVVRGQRTAAQPVIDLALFRTSGFNVPLLINALATFAMIGFSLFQWQFMQLLLSMGPFESAMWSLPAFLLIPVGIALATATAPRIAKPEVTAAGLAVAAAGCLALAVIQSDSGITHLVSALAVVPIGIGGVSAVVTEMILSAAPPERAGAASALAGTSAEFGGALGIAVLGSIGTAVYRSQMDAQAPAGLTSGQRAAAEETLGGAVDTAATLPHQTAEALRKVAVDAFGHEVRITAVASVVVTAGGAILIASLLHKSRQPGSGADPAAGSEHTTGHGGRPSDDLPAKAPAS
ncbi:MFS transporter [Streptomyces albus]|uniref:MFS transporter n=1 Tax=Streptomyces albus TaxID=1888 RepID=UPI0033F6FDBE